MDGGLSAPRGACRAPPRGYFWTENGAELGGGFGVVLGGGGGGGFLGLRLRSRRRKGLSGECPFQQGKEAAGDGVGGGGADLLRAKAEIEADCVRVGEDLQAAGTIGAGCGQGMPEQGRAMAPADCGRIDEEKGQVGQARGIGETESNDAEGEVILAGRDPDPAEGEEVRRDRQMGRGLIHEGGIIAPMRL